MFETHHQIPIPDHDGELLEAWSARTANPNPQPDAYAILYCDSDERAEEAVHVALETWAGHDIEVWCINYPGYGGSSGPATLDLVAPCALLAYDHVRKLAEGRPVYVMGQGFGTAPAMYVSYMRRIVPGALIVRTPTPLRQVVLGHHGWYNLWLAAGPIAMRLPAELDTLSNAQSVGTSAVFIVTGQDSVIPSSYQQEVIDSYGLKLRGGSSHTEKPRVILLKDGAHDDHPVGDQYRELREGIDWVWDKWAPKHAGAVPAWGQPPVDGAASRPGAAPGLASTPMIPAAASSVAVPAPPINPAAIDDAVPATHVGSTTSPSTGNDWIVPPPRPAPAQTPSPARTTSPAQTTPTPATDPSSAPGGDAPPRGVHGPPPAGPTAVAAPKATGHPPAATQPLSLIIAGLGGPPDNAPPTTLPTTGPAAIAPLYPAPTTAPTTSPATPPAGSHPPVH